MRLYNVETSSNHSSTPTLTKSQPNLFSLTNTRTINSPRIPENKRYDPYDTGKQNKIVNYYEQQLKNNTPNSECKTLDMQKS